MKGPNKSTVKLTPPEDDAPHLNVTGKGAEPDNTIKNIQVKVPISKHAEMKAFAAENHMSISAMMMEAYNMFKAAKK